MPHPLNFFVARFKRGQPKLAHRGLKLKHAHL
jgi:hypothetical protein